MRNGDAVKFIRLLKDFQGSNFSGSRKIPGESSRTYGQLPYTYINDVQAADYVVYSYATPIGWHTPEKHNPSGRWTVPSLKDGNENGKTSSSTGRHQTIVRNAI